MLRLTVLLVLTTLVLLGAPSNCAPGSLTDYLTLDPDGCRLGSRVLSDFFLGPVSQGASQIDPSTVLITPSAAGNTGSLVFSYNASVGMGSILESIFQMTVAPDFGAAEKVDLQLIGATATGDGVALGIVDLCSDFLIPGACTGTSLSLIALVDSTNSLPLASAIFAQVGSFDLQHDVVIDAGLFGTASITSAQLTFTAVPEPATVVTFLTGIVATFVFRRRHEGREP